MSDRITMLNRALLRIGADPLVTELDPGAPQHLAIYDSTIERMAAHPWSFMKTTRQLVRLSAAPVPAHFLYAFQMPSLVGAPRAVYADATQRRPVTDYDIEGDQLLTNWEAIYLSYMRLVEPARWPGDFREAFVTALMAELALSVREDRPLHDRLYQKAFGTPQQMGQGGLYGMAMESDAQGVPSTPIAGGVNPLIDVRF
jgi:hypothetical protein